MKIVVLDRSSVGEDVSVAPFEKYGEVVLYSNTVAAEAAERVKDADIIVVNKTPMNETTLSGASRVRLICEFATGFDNIDLDYCRSRGITVVNVRNYSTAVVAQHTFAMALYLMEKLRYYDDYVKNGVYASQSSFSHFGMTFGELDGKTWGIVVNRSPNPLVIPSELPENSTKAGTIMSPERNATLVSVRATV